MRRLLLLLTLVGAVLLACSGVVLAQQTEERTTQGSNKQDSKEEQTTGSDGAPPETPKKPIPDNYIVVLKEGADPDRVANEHASQHGAQPKFVYRHAIRGYAGVIPEGRLEAIRNDSRVAYVEQDQEASISAQKKKDSSRAGKPSREDASASGQTLPWGIDRIDADISSTKAGDGTGAISNVNVYVIDTGVGKHGDLNKVGHVNFAGGKNDDCHGHGTHVAGSVAAKDNGQDVVGVAPGAPITGVKVLGCSGSGSYSGVIKGVDWVTANAKKPAIANMSLGGGASQAVDDAVKKSADSGVFYSIAAGNDGEDACEQSPARAGTHNGVMTVAATDKADKETSWSNYGKCVDIWEPGASILSTKRGGGTTTMSGTSMAAPHTGGAAALYLSANTGKTPAEVETQKKADAVDGTDGTNNTTSKDGSQIKLGYAGKY